MQREWMIRMAQLGYPIDTLSDVWARASSRHDAPADSGAPGDVTPARMADNGGASPAASMALSDELSAALRRLRGAEGGPVGVTQEPAPYGAGLGLGRVGGDGSEGYRKEKGPSGSSLGLDFTPVPVPIAMLRCAMPRIPEAPSLVAAGDPEMGRRWHTLTGFLPSPRSEEDRRALELASSARWSDRAGDYPLGSGRLGLGIPDAYGKRDEPQAPPAFLKARLRGAHGCADVCWVRSLQCSDTGRFRTQTPGDVRAALSGRLPMSDFPEEITRSVEVALRSLSEQAKQVYRADGLREPPTP